MSSAAFPCRPRRIFDGMPSGAFAHPADRRHMRLLKTVPGIEWLTNQLVKRSYERMVRVTLTANAVKVSANAYPVLAELLEAACASLDVARPDLYVRRGEDLQARSFGSEHPVISLSTGLLEMLDESEALCILAQQASHIHCQHLWYLMVCDFCRDCHDLLGPVGAPLVGLRLPLEEWRRRAELSGDRGALLVCGDLPMQLNLIAKLAGAGMERFGAVSPEALLAQEETFVSETRGLNLGRLYRAHMYLDPSHPFSALRAAELKRWAESKEYAALEEGRYDDCSEDAGGPPLWGEYVPPEPAGGPPPVEPVEVSSDALFKGLRGAADGAFGMVQESATAVQETLGGLLGSLPWRKSGVSSSSTDKSP